MEIVKHSQCGLRSRRVGNPGQPGLKDNKWGVPIPEKQLRDAATLPAQKSQNNPRRFKASAVGEVVEVIGEGVTITEKA
jgi:hypothetical protein